MSELPAENESKYVKVECVNCKETEEAEFASYKHPKGYICPRCNGINCVELFEWKASKEEFN